MGSSIVSLELPSAFRASGQPSANLRLQQSHQSVTIPVIAVDTQRSVCRTNETALKFDVSEADTFKWARSRHGGKEPVRYSLTRVKQASQLARLCAGYITSTHRLMQTRKLASSLIGGHSLEQATICTECQLREIPTDTRAIQSLSYTSLHDRV